jgi:hypothetical protein
MLLTISMYRGNSLRGYPLDSRRQNRGDYCNQWVSGGSSVSRNEQGQWHRILISYDVWHRDYGEKANVDFYVTMREGKTIVIVFMYAGSANASVTQQILNSFSWQ